MAPGTKLSALAAVLLARGALSVDVAFVQDANCTGLGLYGTRDIPYLPCYDLSQLDPAMSVRMRNITEGQTLHFFSDGDCQMDAVSTTDRGDQCFTATNGKIGSFSVSSPDAISQHHERDATTTDVAPYSVKMSDYTALGVFEPEAHEAILTILALGVGGIAIGSSLNFYSAVNTCKALGDGFTGKKLWDCLVSPLAVIFTVVGGKFLHQAGRQARGRFDATTGQIVELAKRSVTIDEANADFVHGMMNGTGHEGSAFVGTVERNMSTGVHTSPVYEVDMGEAGLWHATSFFEQDGNDFIHHMRPASETPMFKRDANYPFNSVRWGDGGLDFRYCEHAPNSGISGYEGKSNSEIYNIAWDQLTCYHQPSWWGDQKAIGMDMYNTRGTVVGEITVIPFRNGNHNAPPACTNSLYAFRQGCAVT